MAAKPSESGSPRPRSGLGLRTVMVAAGVALVALRLFAVGTVVRRPDEATGDDERGVDVPVPDVNQSGSSEAATAADSLVPTDADRIAKDAEPGVEPLSPAEEPFVGDEDAATAAEDASPVTVGATDSLPTSDGSAQDSGPESDEQSRRGRTRRRQRAVEEILNEVDEQSTGVGPLDSHLQFLTKDLKQSQRTVGMLLAERDSLRRQLAALQAAQDSLDARLRALGPDVRHPRQP